MITQVAHHAVYGARRRHSRKLDFSVVACSNRRLLNPVAHAARIHRHIVKLVPGRDCADVIAGVVLHHIRSGVVCAVGIGHQPNHLTRPNGVISSGVADEHIIKPHGYRVQIGRPEAVSRKRRSGLDYCRLGLSRPIYLPINRLRTCALIGSKVDSIPGVSAECRASLKRAVTPAHRDDTR